VPASLVVPGVSAPGERLGTSGAIGERRPRGGPVPVRLRAQFPALTASP